MCYYYSCNTIVGAFRDACRRDDENEAKSIVEMDPEFHSKQDEDGITGLMIALFDRRYSFARWMLSLPGLDLNLQNSGYVTALHYACWWMAPLDIVISVARLSSWETVNMEDWWDGTDTVLDCAVGSSNTSAALYLSWLGAECKEMNRKYREVILQTWIDEGCQHEAQFWAVAANDINALKHLVDVEHVELDRPKLSTLAKLFDHRAVWSYVTSLKSLAWDRIKQMVPSVLNRSPEDLMEAGVESVEVGILVKMRNAEPESSSL